MSFQQLPTEVKQLILDEAAKSDQTYQSLRKKEGKKLTARQTRGPLGPVPGRPVERVVSPADCNRGTAVSALSLTSRELRELSVKYLFETYRLSNAYNPTIVLSEPAKSAVTRLLDSGQIGHHGLGSDSTRIIAALPNLRRIVIDKLETPSILEADWKRLRSEEATKNISEWEVRLYQVSAKREVARLLRSHPSILRYISINHEIPGDKPYFDDPTQLQALSDCPGLTKLVLSSTRYPLHRRFNETFRPSTVPFFASALSTHFLFANSLTSLSLSRRSQANFSAPIDASFLTFASLFPNLTHLRLEAEGIIIDDSPFAITGSFSLPSLLSLEISLHTFEPTVRLLDTLSLPSLRRLSLIFEVRKTSTTDNPDFSLLAQPLPQFEHTLKALDLTSTHSTYRTELDALAKRTLPQCQIRTNWEEGDVRYESTSVETELEKVVAEARRYGEWIVQEAERAGKEGSLTNAKDLLGTLELVKERKKWMDL